MAERDVKADLSALQVEVRDLRGAVERNTESLSEIREGFQRLRGELNGSLPRLEEKVGRLVDRLDAREAVEREYHEKVRVQEREIESLAEANREEHGRLWLALRLFFYGILIALAALLLAKSLG